MTSRQAEREVSNAGCEVMEPEKVQFGARNGSGYLISEALPELVIVESLGEVVDHLLRLEQLPMPPGRVDV